MGRYEAEGVCVGCDVIKAQGVCRDVLWMLTGGEHKTAKGWRCRMIHATRDISRPNNSSDPHVEPSRIFSTVRP